MQQFRVVYISLPCVVIRADECRAHLQHLHHYRRINVILHMHLERYRCIYSITGALTALRTLLQHCGRFGHITDAITALPCRIHARDDCRAHTRTRPDLRHTSGIAVTARTGECTTHARRTHWRHKSDTHNILTCMAPGSHIAAPPWHGGQP